MATDGGGHEPFFQKNHSPIDGHLQEWLAIYHVSKMGVENKCQSWPNNILEIEYWMGLRRLMEVIGRR